MATHRQEFEAKLQAIRDGNGVSVEKLHSTTPERTTYHVVNVRDADGYIVTEGRFTGKELDTVRAEIEKIKGNSDDQ